MSNVEFLRTLIKKYENEIRNFEIYKKWQEDNPEMYYDEYPGRIPNASELKRLGIMIRKEMILIENRTNSVIYV